MTNALPADAASSGQSSLPSDVPPVPPRPVSPLRRPALWLLMLAGWAVVTLLCLMPSAAPHARADDSTATPTPTYPWLPADCRFGFDVAPLNFWIFRVTPGAEATIRSFRTSQYITFDYTFLYPFDGWPPATMLPDPNRNVMTPVRYGMEQVFVVRLHSVPKATPLPYHTPRYFWNEPLITPLNDQTPAWEYHGGTPAVGPNGTPAYNANVVYSASNYKGALWLIGNEIDHADKSPSLAEVTATRTPNATVAYDYVNQDGIAPEAYAVAYHDIRRLIKSIDPTALVAPGSVVMWSPARAAYYDRVIAEWDRRFGATEGPFPADWWNVHNYKLNEYFWSPHCAETPAPGVTPTYPACSVVGTNISIPLGFDTPPPPGSTQPPGQPTWTPTPTPPGNQGIPGATATPWPYWVLDRGRFKQQIVDFRKWLAARGYQNTPVIVSEYGQLIRSYFDLPTVAGPYLDDIWQWMLGATDPQIGYPADGYHLVQRWVYFNAMAYSDPGFVYTTVTNAGPGGVGPPQLEPFGIWWSSNASAPENGFRAWPCQLGTPNSWAPALYYLPTPTTQAGGSGAAGQSGAGGAGAGAGNGTPYPPP